MTTAIVENKTRPLVATDRCDRCGAGAMLVARTHSEKQELFFCNHHANQHKESLVEAGFYMDSETIEDRL